MSHAQNKNSVTALDNSGWGIQPSSSQTRIMIAPYSYLFGMNGNMTVHGNSSKISTTPMDVINNLDKIDFIFQLRAEAFKRRWGVFIDPTYLKISAPFSNPPAAGTVTPELGIFDYGASYTVKENFNRSTPYKVQAFVAGRYFAIKNTLTFNRLGSFSGKQNFNTPLVGMRYIQ